MRVQRTFLSVAFLAYFAYERPLASMLSHMIIQIALRSSCVFARLALEGLFPSMDSHMDLDRLFLGETFPTNIAMIWSLSSMSPKKYIEISFWKIILKLNYNIAHYITDV